MIELVRRPFRSHPKKSGATQQRNWKRRNADRTMVSTSTKNSLPEVGGVEVVVASAASLSPPPPLPSPVPIGGGDDGPLLLLLLLLLL